MVYYLTPARFTWFTVDRRMFELTLPPAGGGLEHLKWQTPHLTRRAKTPQYGFQKCLWQPCAQTNPKAKINWQKQKRKKKESVGGGGENAVEAACLYRGQQQQVSWTGSTGFYGVADSCGTSTNHLADDCTKYHE